MNTILFNSIVTCFRFNNIIDKAVDVLIGDYIGYSTLMWGLVPSGNYPGARDKYLLGDEFKYILPQTEWFYQAQLNRYDNILKAIDDGVEVFDIVDYNCYLYEICDSWNKVNADGIIQLDSTSMGAYSAGVDKKLPEGYVCENDHCGNPAHDHSDPNNIVDARAGLLPETTFYFYGQNHEKTASNNIIMFLAADLLTDDNFKDVFTYPDKYPQFNVERNSKGLMRDIDKMKAYDVSSLTSEQQAKLQGAIEVAEAAINNTNMTSEDFEEAKNYFYQITAEITNPQSQSETESGGFSFLNIDFEAILAFFFRILSDLLFNKFGGAGFNEILFG